MRIGTRRSCSLETSGKKEDLFLLVSLACPRFGHVPPDNEKLHKKRFWLWRRMVEHEFPEVMRG